MKIARETATGAVALLALTAVIALIPSPGVAPQGSFSCGIPHASHDAGTVPVEVTGDSGRNGVYFVPRGTPVPVFLGRVGIRPEDARQSLPGHSVLDQAATVSVLRAAERVDIRPMAAAKRLALGIPIDVNRCGPEELVLVPGIGEATAERILEQRGRAGRFRNLDDLTQVRGIKEKRLERLRPYLCVGC